MINDVTIENLSAPAMPRTPQDAMLIVPIPEREFNLYGLSLPEGPNFEPYVTYRGGNTTTREVLVVFCSIMTRETSRSAYSVGVSTIALSLPQTKQDLIPTMRLSLN